MKNRLGFVFALFKIGVPRNFDLPSGYYKRSCLFNLVNQPRSAPGEKKISQSIYILSVRRDLEKKGQLNLPGEEVEEEEEGLINGFAAPPNCARENSIIMLMAIRGY